MKLIFFLALGLFSSVSMANVESLKVSGKVVSFDGKIVVIEIAGEKFNFDRKKLGKEFASLKQGDPVELEVDKKSLTKSEK